MFDIGDKVQARDGRIGIVVDTKKIVVSEKSSNFQQIVVKFPDGFTIDGLSEDFKGVFDRPFSKVGHKY
jgi:hypothetical protein